MKLKFVLILIVLNLLCISSIIQATESPFGSATSDLTSLRGDIYYLSEGTPSLPEFSSLTPVGSIYTKVLDIPQRSFTSGFPGVTDRFEWFAIRYTGAFSVDMEGDYTFRLVSDDGSRLFIDGNKIIDNDGQHPTQSISGSVYLAPGKHSIEVDYFQGPREEIALQLFWTPPGGSEGIANPQYTPGTLPNGTASITDLKWQGMDDDKVGDWDNGSPDGKKDGRFLLTLDLPGQKEVKSVEIYSADANGNHVGGQVWHTASTDYWILGVFYQGNQLDLNHMPSLGIFSGNLQFDLYADDSGWFKPGNWFGAEVILGDGTKLNKLIYISDGSSSNVNLTGVWDCDDAGTYYIRQIGNTVWWDGDDPDGAWANVAHGTIDGNTITLEYADVPEGTSIGYGKLVLNIVSNDELEALEKPGSYGGSSWWRNSKSQPPEPSEPSEPIDPDPWNDPDVRSLIDEWLRQQDSCVKEVYPGAYIDKWGRICGETETATISCVLEPDHPSDWDNYRYLWDNNWCPDYYPYRVQDYVELRQSGYSFDDLAGCKGEYESCY